jgi:hypothetical protein
MSQCPTGRSQALRWEAFEIADSGRLRGASAARVAGRRSSRSGRQRCLSMRQHLHQGSSATITAMKPRRARGTRESHLHPLGPRQAPCACFRVAHPGGIFTGSRLGLVACRDDDGRRPPRRPGRGAAATGAVTRVAASSGRFGTFVPSARRRRRWHDLSGERALGGDHDQSPVTGADREGMGVMLLEDAHDVGDLLAVIWAGPAPADHDPLTDIGRCEPDHEPVAQAGHPFRGAAPCAAVGLATALSPAGDVAGDVVGVVGQRAGLGSAAGRFELGEEPDVLGGELGPLFGHVVFVEDRLGPGIPARRRRSRRTRRGWM